MLCSFLLTILEFPRKLLNLQRFIMERKARYADFKIGDWVRFREMKSDRFIKIVAQDAQGRMHELKPPVFVPTTAEYLFFTEREPFEVVKVYIMPIGTEVRTYIRYRNCDQGHPCSLMLRNSNVQFGKNTIDFAPGSLVEKVPSPSYSSKPQ